MIRFLRQCGHDEVLETECLQLINYFDNSEIGQLVYNDFLQIILPCDAPIVRAMALDKISLQRTSARIDPVVESELAILLYKEIVFARQLDKIRMKLQAHKAFEPAAAFQVVDDWNYGYIDQTNLKNFLRKHGHVTSDADLLAVIRRIDLDGDARINEQEFSYSLKLEQPFSKANFRHYQK